MAGRVIVNILLSSHPELRLLDGCNPSISEVDYVKICEKQNWLTRGQSLLTFPLQVCGHVSEMLAAGSDPTSTCARY